MYSGEVWVENDDARVGASIDVDGAMGRVWLAPSPYDEAEPLVLSMSPKTARRVARALNFWARTVERAPLRRR